MIGLAEGSVNRGSSVTAPTEPALGNVLENSAAQRLGRNYSLQWNAETFLRQIVGIPQEPGAFFEYLRTTPDFDLFDKRTPLRPELSLNEVVPNGFR